MSAQQLWVGYYQLIYATQPNTHYFGHLIGFADSRDDFQQQIESYKTQHQCKLISQLAPLPATTWFERHGHQANIWSAAQQLKEQALRFLPVQEETHAETKSYLSQESITIAPLPTIFEMHTHQPPYLPEALLFHPFFAQLNSRDNPKEGLFYANPDFSPNPDSYRYYAVVDGVKSFVLPQLCESEGQTDSLYKGELKNRMDTNAPYLTQLTVGDRENSEFTRILFTRAEEEWFGCWDMNPAIVIRTTRSFEEVHYHLRKFIHLYKEENQKWYFFRFYDPQVLVAYLRYIEHDAARLATFFGFRDGESVIESFAARVENRFSIFSLQDLPPDTRPGAVAFDDDMERFLAEYAQNQFAEKLLTEILPQEFPALIVSKEKVRQWIDYAMKLEITNEGALELFAKAECYLLNSKTAVPTLISTILTEYGKLSEVELAKVFYLKAKEIKDKE